MEHVVIIGNGISGVTCARYIRKQDSHIKITIISAETKHFFSRTALMYIYMGHMTYENTKPYEDFFWEKNRIGLIHKYVTKVDTDSKSLTFADNSTLRYDKLVLATGSKSNFFGWEGQDLKGVQGLYSFQDLQQMEYNTTDVKHAVIIGGGLIGVEMAEMLLSRDIEVTFLVREGRFWDKVLSPDEAKLIEAHMNEHHVKLLTNAELDKVIGDDTGKVKQVITKEGKTIDCQFVGITAGVSPNINFIEDSAVETDKGILINEYFETNIKDIYAIGDCAQFTEPLKGRKPIEQVWYTGRMHGQVLAQTICGNKTKYQPGPWFNSAKFFDIEYQNYGLIPAEPEEQEDVFFWRANKANVAIRVHFDKESKQLIGINSFGLRLRHELFDRWLAEEKSIEYVLIHLADANFDPEFYKNYEAEIINSYNEKFNSQLKSKKKSWSRILDNLKKLQHA